MTKSDFSYGPIYSFVNHSGYGQPRTRSLFKRLCTYNSPYNECVTGLCQPVTSSQVADPRLEIQDTWTRLGRGWWKILFQSSDDYLCDILHALQTVWDRCLPNSAETPNYYSAEKVGIVVNPRSSCVHRYFLFLDRSWLRSLNLAYINFGTMACSSRCIEAIKPLCGSFTSFNVLCCYLQVSMLR